jgi:ubiquinone/menaquinone biosynthesis C-methylase UbiE
MQLDDAIGLIGRSLPGHTWADLGCGSGLFTYALANLLPHGSTIYALDKSRTPLTAQANPQQVTIHQQQADFIKDEIAVPRLDGILMANALHYAAAKQPLLAKLGRILKDNGAFLVIEYDTEKANPWVPYPVRFVALRELFHANGYTSVTRLGERPSVYGAGKMYAALATREQPSALPGAGKAVH